MQSKRKLNPHNFKSIEYDLHTEVMTIRFKTSEVIDGYNRTEAKYRCSYESYQNHVNRWILRLNLSKSG